MFGHSWRVGRIAGIEIRIDSSWIVIALLITYSLYLQIVSSFSRLAQGPAILLALMSALLFFGSVLTHEMAHSLVARARGIPVKGITLFLFGGATQARAESRKPGDEFIITIVGPLTSLLLAGVFWVLGIAGRAFLPDPVAGTFLYLAFVNGALAVFNLLPGFPLDGGRVLRSIVWKVTGNLPRATRIASIGGQVVGFLLIATGVVLLTAFGDFGGGIWLAAIGWFLAQAARAQYEELQVRQLLQRIDAEDVMAGDLVRIPGTITVQRAVDDYFMRHDHSAFPVEETGRTIGLLTLRGVKRIPREEWATRTVREAMGSLDDQITVSPGTRMDTVLTRLQGGEARRVLVTRDGEVIGIITPLDLARWLERWKAVKA